MVDQFDDSGDVFPRSNLPANAQEWVRSVEKRLANTGGVARRARNSATNLSHQQQLVTQQIAQEKIERQAEAATIVGTGPVKAPSAPTLTTKLGTVIARWDGKLYDGTPLPLAFSHVVAEYTTTAPPAYVAPPAADENGQEPSPPADTVTWTPASQSLNAAGDAIISGIPVGTSVWVRFKAYTFSGVASYPSNHATVTVQGVAMVDTDATISDAIANSQDTADTALNTANGKNTSYYQATMPTGGTYKVGDLWFDTDDNYKLYTHDGTTFVLAQDAASAAATAAAAQSTADTALTTADGKNTAYYQTAQPTGGTYKVGDLWFDTDDGYKLRTWSGTAWVLTQDSAGALATANSKNKTTHSDTAPASPAAGDIWIDSANGNILKRWSGSAWTTVQDAAIATAQSTADTALTSANGKNKITYSTTAPTSSTPGHPGDIYWVRTGDIITAQYLCTAGTGTSSGNTWTPQTLRHETIASVDAGTITVGTLSADRIGANTITATKLAIGDFTNLVPDDVLSAAWGTTWYNATGGSTGTATTIVSDPGVPGNAIQVEGRGVQIIVWAREFAPVNPGGKYRLMARAMNGLTPDGAGTLRVYWYKEDKSSFAATQFNLISIPNGATAWTDYSLEVTAPADARYARIMVETAAAATGGSWRIGRMQLRSMVPGVLIEGGAVTADKMAANSITAANAAIADLAVTTAKIDNLAITDAKINDLNASKINAGFISSARIAAGSINARQMTLGDSTNLIDDPQFTQYSFPDDTVSAWFSPSNGAVGSGIVTDASAPGPTLRMVANGVQQLVDNRVRPTAKSGDRFLASVRGSNTTNGAAVLRVYFLTESGSIISQHDVGIPQGGAWGDYKLALPAAPANTERILARFVLAAAATTGEVRFAKPQILRMASGELIVDGAITANSAIIANGAISEAQIGTLSAGKITTGFLDSARIAANSISVDKLLVTNLDNLVPDPSFETGAGANSLAWNATNANASIATADARTGTNCLQVTAAASAYVAISTKDANQIRVEAGERYALGAFVRLLSGTVTTGAVTLRVSWRSTATGALTATSDIARSPAGVSTTYVQMEPTANSSSATTPVWTVPANAKYARFEVVSRGTNGAVYLVDDVYMIKQQGATLIEDGAITTDKLTASAVTTNKLAAGAVTANEIAAGAVTAVKLAANSVTADKLSATAIDGKTITGATLQTAASGKRAIVEGTNVRFYNAGDALSGQIEASGTGTTDNQLLVSSAGSNVYIGNNDLPAGGTADIRTGVVWADEVVTSGLTKSDGTPWLNDTGWLAFTGWANSFSNSTSAPTKYRLVGKQVWLHGELWRSAAPTTPTHAMTLPVGYRPSVTVYAYTTPFGNGDQPVAVEVRPTGEVYIVCAVVRTSGTGYSVSGVTFLND